MSDLSAAFLSRRPDLAWPPALRPALTDRLAGLLSAARAAWPALSLSPERFVEHLAAHAGTDTTEALLTALARAPAADLYLACACAAGDAAAIRALDEGPLAEVPVPRPPPPAPHGSSGGASAPVHPPARWRGRHAAHQHLRGPGAAARSSLMHAVHQLAAAFSCSLVGQTMYS